MQFQTLTVNLPILQPILQELSSQEPGWEAFTLSIALSSTSLGSMDFFKQIIYVEEFLKPGG